MKSKNEADLFLIRDGADEFLTAGAREPKHVLDAVCRGDFEVGLRCDFLLCHRIDRSLFLRVTTPKFNIQRQNRKPFSYHMASLNVESGISSRPHRLDESSGFEFIHKARVNELLGLAAFGFRCDFGEQT